jgi:DNA-binding GntR family transcriptional regulator
MTIAVRPSAVGPSLLFRKAVDNPIDRRTLPDELIGHLRDMIGSGQLRAGSRVSVTGLCRRFGVSRTPLREALKMLAVEGLLIMSPNKSAIVAAPSRERMDELIPLLSAREVLAGELACARIDDSGLKHLRLLHQRCVDCFEGRDVSAYMDTEAAMRNLIFQFADNRRLTDVYRILYAQLRLPALAGNAPLEWSKAVQEQNQILQALEMKDADMCSLVTRRYMRHRVAMLQAFLSTDVNGRRGRRGGGAGGATPA